MDNDRVSKICDVICKHNLSNIRELRRFIKEHGTKYNLPDMKMVNSVLSSHAPLIRLYFDAVYQERKDGLR